MMYNPTNLILHFRSTNRSTCRRWFANPRSGGHSCQCKAVHIYLYWHSRCRSLDHALDLIRTTTRILSPLRYCFLQRERERGSISHLISLSLNISDLMTKKQIKAEFPNEVDILRSTLADVKVKLPGLDAFLLANPVSNLDDTVLTIYQNIQ